MIENMDSSLIDLLKDLENVDQPLKLQCLVEACIYRGRTGHLAVLTQPYLKKILAGEKTIESRFSKKRIAPFENVHSGDILFLKGTGGPIYALALVDEVHCFGPLRPGDAENIMDTYQEGLQIEEDFRNSKRNSCYATLILMKNILPTKPLLLEKRDRRAWVILSKRS